MDEEGQEIRSAEALSLGVGSLPTAAVAWRLLKAMDGFKTGIVVPPSGGLDPNQLFNLVKSLIDAEIQLFLQGFITAEQMAAYIAGVLTHDFIATLGFIDNTALAGYRFLTADAVAAYNFVTSGQLAAAIAGIPAATVGYVDSLIAGVKGDISVLNTEILKIPGIASTVDATKTITDQMQKDIQSLFGLFGQAPPQKPPPVIVTGTPAPGPGRVTVPAGYLPIPFYDWVFPIEAPTLLPKWAVLEGGPYNTDVETAEAAKSIIYSKGGLLELSTVASGISKDWGMMRGSDGKYYLVKVVKGYAAGPFPSDAAAQDWFTQNSATLPTGSYNRIAVNSSWFLVTG